MGIEKIKHNIQGNITNPKIKEQNNKRRKLRERRYLDNLAIRDEQKKNRVIFGTSITMFVFICASIFILNRYNTIYTIQGDITNFNRDIKVMSEKNEDLNIRISEGASLEKIEKVAFDKLDMIYPNRDDSMNILP